MDADLRRLLFAAVGLGLLLFVGRAVVDSVWDDTALRRSVIGLRRSLASGGDAAERPDRADRVAAADRATELSERLDALVPAVQYERPEAFDVPSSASPDLRYIEVLRREQQELVDAARFVGRSVPRDLGMPVPNPTGLEDVLDALRALHVVHCVVDAALEAGVDAVDAIRVPPAVRGRREEAGFLRARPVEFELVGSPASLREALGLVVDGEPWLALDDVRLQALDEDGQRLRCRLQVASVSVDVEAETPGEGAL